MTSERGQVRVFVALDLPPQAKESLNKTVGKLRNSLPAGVRWVRPEGIHLTLKFLGDVESAMVEPLLGAIAAVAARDEHKPFSLELSGLGVFPNTGEPRVLWAGVAGELDELGRLQQSMEDAICGLGYQRERRPFRPHLTLGRVREHASPADRRDIGAQISQANPLESSPWQVTEVHLISSNLTPQGAIYASLGASNL